MALEQVQVTPVPPQKDIQKKSLTEAPFAKKRVEETPNIEPEKLIEPTPQISLQPSIDTTEKAEKIEKIQK